MIDRTELLAAWRAHVRAKGDDSAEKIIARFCDDADDPSPHDVPGDKVDAAIRALREGLPAARASVTAPKTMADIDHVAIYARWNSVRRPKPTTEV